MPYRSVDDLPPTVRNRIKSPKRRRQWMHVWNSEYAAHSSERRAFAGAWSAVQKRLLISKNDALYVDHPVDDDRCSGCTMFLSPGECSLVRGRISPNGHCKYFEAKKMNKATASGSGDTFSVFLPITKIDRERRLISGYASTPALDLDGEIVALDAVRKALPGYMQWRNIRRMHTADAVGVAKEASVDDKGLFLTSKIIDDDCWNKVLEGVYKGYSIGGKKLNKTGNTITEIELVEISVVDRPANPECRFDVHKKAENGAPAYLTKLPKAESDPKLKAIDQMAKAVRSLSKAGPPAAKDGFSLPAEVKKTEDKCAAHGTVDCKICGPVDAQKRDVSTKERKELAGENKALPDGSFPIKNKKDLSNARQAIGRAKNPSATKAFIRRRAKELGVKLPPSWNKKLAKVLIASAEAEKLDIDSTGPSFLTLSVEGQGGLVKGLRSGHEPQVVPSTPRNDGNFTKRERKILKRMGVAGQLSYCFDSIRSAQRDLLREAKQEGGDMKDKGLATKLGSLAQQLAGIIGQKAEHEGSEALDLSDADDQGFLNLGAFTMSAKNKRNTASFDDFSSNDPVTAAILDVVKRATTPSRAARMQMARGDLKKARGAVKDMEEAIKAAHAMHKSAYLSKAAASKKKTDDGDDDDFDHQGAMEKLQKAFGSVQTVKTMIKSAGGQLKKAMTRSGQRGQEVSDGTSDYTVPAGVKDLTPGGVDTAGGTSAPFVHGMETPFPGKGARIKKGMVSASEADALARAAAAEAKVEVLSSMPAGPVFGKKPGLTDMAKIVGGTADETASIMKGVEVGDLTKDEQSNQKAISRMIGNMIVGGHGKSVLDDTFRGTGGLA